MKPTKSRKKLQNSSGRRKGTRDLIDRVSPLPDSILSLILSSLPTKNVVATSILSKRWKLLWTTVLNLDFSHMRYTNEEDEDEDMKFVQFVNRVLLLHDARFLLHKFRLVWKPWCIPSQVDSWISTAITRNVRQLVLYLDRYERMGGPFEIPTSIFSSGTLQSLVLKGIMWVSASIVVCLPRLETLKLDSIYFKSEEALHKIIRGCPMLNYLYLHMVLDIHQHYFGNDDDRSEFRYIISSTSLRRLELDADFWNSSFPLRLELEASSLEYLKIDGFMSQIFVQGSLSSLVEADFRILWWDESEYTQDTYNSVVEVVRAFDCAKSLTLSTHVMWALSHATICLSTKFSRLTKLEAEADCFCCTLEDFIQSSDNLEVLTIYQHSIDGYVSDLEENDYDHSNWTAPLEVPRCLSNSLRAVVFDGYCGINGEREMIGYMLKHGYVLEVMKISCYSSEHVKFELVQEICNFPRKSPACKVEFLKSRLCKPWDGGMCSYFSD